MSRHALTFILLSIVAVAVPAPAAEFPRAVGQWHLDGDAEDSSGRGHAGVVSGATFVPRGHGRALRLDTKAGFVRIAAHADLDVGRAGTIEMWCRPQSRHGALFSWGQASERANRNFVVVFDTRPDWGEPGGELRLWSGGGRRYQTYSTELPDLPLERWTHVVVSIDGATLIFYYDGAPVMEVALPFVMDLADQSLVIGRYEWSGEDVFRGLIDDVALYDRPLSGREVLELYRRTCASFDHDATLRSRPAMELHVQSEAGRIGVRVRTAKMGALPAGTTVRAALTGTNARNSAPIDPAARPTFLSLDAAAVPAGSYELQCTFVGPDGTTIGRPSRERVSWPGRDPAFANVRVLNNLVWEVLSVRPGDLAGERRYEFTQPKRRWIYVRAEGRDFEVMVNGIKATVPEAMLFLPQGRHTLVLRPRGTGHVDSLIVRSIPRIIFDSMIPDPHVASAIPFNEDFIRRHIVPHVNTFTVVSSTRKPRPEQPLFREILGTGRRILGHCLVPTKTGDEPITAEGAAVFVAGTWGMTHPDLNGSIADEFGISVPHCAAYARAWRRLHADPRFADREYVPYVGRLYTGGAGRELVKALVDTGSAFAFKRYLRCPGTEQAAYDYARRSLLQEARKYRTLCPGSIESMIVCFGYFCAPNEFLNVAPQANYKTFLDMQFRMVAHEPEFWAARGLHNYLVHYADEETSRWVVHLYRHYGIEGATRPAATDPFDSSSLLADGDFADAPRHWRLQPAAPESMTVVDEIHFGWLQGRYPFTPRGDNALRMVRHADKPNVAAQTIRNLQPGRLYAARMISAVHGDMTGQQPHALRLDVRGARVLPEPSYTRVYPNSYAHSYGDYNTDHRAWLTYHWLLFRAEAAEAELTISDWADDDRPGGPIGQPLILNFVQVHPYFETGL